MKKKIALDNKIANIVITPLQGISLVELMEYESILNLVRTETPKRIQRAIAANKENATIVEINNSGYYIEIPYKFWRNALTSCLDFFSKKEQFEVCTSIQLVVNSLNEYEKIPTSVRKKNTKRKRYGE